MLPLLPFALLAAAAAATAPVPIEPHLGLTPGDYPTAAYFDALQGEVVFRLTVDAAGSVSDCTIVRSSGHAILDDHSCTLLRERARFSPATDAQGNAVAATYERGILWQLPGERFTGRHHALTVEVDATGRRLGCEAEWVLLAAVPGRSCEALDEQAVERLAELAPRYRSVTFLTATNVGMPPARAERPRWGERLSYTLAEHIYPGDAPYPVRCRAVAAEGLAEGEDPCMGFEPPENPPGFSGPERMLFLAGSILGVRR